MSKSQNWGNFLVKDAILELVAGKSPNRKEYPARPGKWGILKTTAIDWNTFKPGFNLEVLDGFNVDEKQQVRKGDVLITKAGPISRVGVVAHVNNVNELLLVSGKMTILRVNERFDSKFLSYVLCLPRSQKHIKNNTTGMASSQTNFTHDSLKETPFRSPCLVEQKKIAQVLSSVDEVIELTEKEISKFQDLKKGMMQELLTKGIGHTKFKDSPVGMIPESWTIKKFDELGLIKRGKSKHRPRGDKILYGGKYPFVQTGDVKASDLYIDSFSQSYNEVGLKQSKLWSSGTLCITIAANIADTAILNFDACFPDSIVGFIADQNISNTVFVKLCFDKLQSDMKAISTGTTQDNMSMEKLLLFEIALPPLDEQNKIVDMMVSVIETIQKKQHKLLKLKETKSGLMQDLLTGKVRVNV